MKVFSISVLFCSILCSAASFSQTTATQHNPTASMLSGGIHLRSISNAPFSADVVKDSLQTLANGTRVPVETNGKMFRDSAGRTRTETELKSATGASLHYVTILDPVTQLNARLDPQTKTATLYPFPATPSATAEAKLTKALAARSATVSRVPALVASQDMGPSTLQGYSVTGTKRTVPAAASAPGSQRARNVVLESWFSPELQIELQSTTEDPQLGLSTTKLVNISIAEPDSALFQVPADYTIKNNSLRK